MPRTSRIVAPGYFHHVTQRGNNRQSVFLADADRDDYLLHLRTNAAREGVRLIGFCLMTNHVHLVVCPERDDSLARFLRRAHGEYSRQFNGRHGRSGHLWQNRFYSCPLEGAHVLNCLRYVDLNPVRARMVGQAADWRWSSAAAHLAGKADEFGLLSIEWTQWRDWPNWADCLDVGQSADELEMFRKHTRLNRPLGSGAFAGAVVRRSAAAKAEMIAKKSAIHTAHAA